MEGISRSRRYIPSERPGTRNLVFLRQRERRRRAGQAGVGRSKEGDGSLEYWKKVHHAALSREMSSMGLVFHEETPVICEEFSVVYPKEN
ncbi:MAG: ASCH domain-containing protein [Synergistota bacterium]|nr:ASCH domain-containing protein [Synergistota bacterium]